MCACRFAGSVYDYVFLTDGEGTWNVWTDSDDGECTIPARANVSVKAFIVIVYMKYNKIKRAIPICVK